MKAVRYKLFVFAPSREHVSFSASLLLCVFAFSQALAATPDAPVHPVYGKAIKTIASDEPPAPIPNQSGGVRAAITELTGTSKPAPVPRVPKRSNLVIDGIELCWSAEHSKSGYIYFAAPDSPLPLWEFSACTKPNLTQLSPDDLATRFVSFSDRTNRSGLGPAVFGTNYLRHAIRVNQGQVILARLAADHNKVYALDFAKQTQTNAEVYYLSAVPTNLATKAQP